MTFIYFYATSKQPNTKHTTYKHNCTKYYSNNILATPRTAVSCDGNGRPISISLGLGYRHRNVADVMSSVSKWPVVDQ